MFALFLNTKSKYKMKNNVHIINTESYAGNFFGFWFYFFYTLKSFRDR
jgi:hypothetical protein